MANVLTVCLFVNLGPWDLWNPDEPRYAQVARKMVIRGKASHPRRSFGTTYPLSMGKYSYQVVVTNMKLTPLNTWRFYNGRAAVDLIINEFKGNYPLGKIPTKHFPANEAYFHTLLFSYNLINWFKRLCLPTIIVISIC